MSASKFYSIHVNLLQYGYSFYFIFFFFFFKQAFTDQENHKEI